MPRQLCRPSANNTGTRENKKVLVQDLQALAMRSCTPQVSSAHFLLSNIDVASSSRVISIWVIPGDNPLLLLVLRADGNESPWSVDHYSNVGVTVCTYTCFTYTCARTFTYTEAHVLVRTPHTEHREPCTLEFSTTMIKLHPPWAPSQATRPGSRRSLGTCELRRAIHLCGPRSLSTHGIQLSVFGLRI